MFQYNNYMKNKELYNLNLIEDFMKQNKLSKLRLSKFIGMPYYTLRMMFKHKSIKSTYLYLIGTKMKISMKDFLIINNSAKNV